MSVQNPYSRRRFVAATGAAALGLLAGCSTTDSSGNGENNGSNNDQGPEHEFKFFIKDSVDLTDLPTSDLDSLEGLRGEEEDYQDYIEFEYKLLEDGKEVEPEHIELILEGENGEENRYVPDSEDIGPEMDNAYMPCTELLEGENTVTAKAKAEGENNSIKATDTTEKKTPETYRAEVQIDGENFDEYTTPYQFDTVNVDTEEYNRLRQEITNENTWNEEIVQPTMENDKVDFEPDFSPSDFWIAYSHNQGQWDSEHFQQLGIEDLRKIILDAGVAFQMHYSKEKDGRSGISGDMHRNAATTTTLVDRHINNISEGENRYKHEREIDLEGGKFNTPNHGNALFYERNTQQWINHDPKRAITSEPANAPDVDKDDRFYPPTDYMIGAPDKHNGINGYDTKKSEGLRSIAVTTQLGLISSDDFDADDHWIQKNTNKIGSNEPLGEDTENILQAATITAYKTPIIYGGDQGENRLLITENRKHWERFRSHNHPEPVTTEEVETEMLT